MPKSVEPANGLNLTASQAGVPPELDQPVALNFVSIPLSPDKEKALEISDFYAHKTSEGGADWKRPQERCNVEFDLEHPNQTPPSYPSSLIDEILGSAACV